MEEIQKRGGFLLLTVFHNKDLNPNLATTRCAHLVSYLYYFQYVFTVERGVSCREGGGLETSHGERTLRGDDEEGVHARRLRPQHGGHVHVPRGRTTR